jgi:hypothetical protein
MSKIMLVAVGAAGYVLGSRAGRERYNQIAEQAQKFWSNPKVIQKRQEAKDAAMAQAPVVKEKLQDVTGKSSSGSDGSMSQQTTPAATQPVV